MPLPWRVGDPVDIGKRMNKVYKPRLDFRLLGLLGVAVALGLFSLALVPSYSSGGNTFLTRQIVWVGLGLLGLVGAYHVNYRWLAKLDLPFYLITLGAVLISLHIPGSKYYWLKWPRSLLSFLGRSSGKRIRKSLVVVSIGRYIPLLRCIASQPFYIPAFCPTIPCYALAGGCGKKTFVWSGW